MNRDVKDSTINSFIIEGLSTKTPLIDIFILLTKQVNDIKKITITHDPINYISNNCKCLVDFNNHDSLLKAKFILQSQNLNNLFNTYDQKIKISECMVNRNNLISETVNKTTALMFENLQVNQTNILEFMLYLKHYINYNAENEINQNKYKISKVRQYSNRILIIFESNVPNCIKNLLRKGDNEFLDEIPFYNYKGKNIPVIPKMKPVVNIGKYKERNIKLSIYNLSLEDRSNLNAIFEKNEENNESNLMLNKMAEIAMNNILTKEKIMREEKMKKLNNMSNMNNNNINMPNNSLNKKRERERERERIKDKNRNSLNREKMGDISHRDIRSRTRDRGERGDRNMRSEKNRDFNSRNIMNERREDSSSIRDRKNDMNMNMNINMNNNNDNYIHNKRNTYGVGENNNLGNNKNNINSINNINSNIGDLNINEKDLNQVASLISNANAMNIVKYLLENNAINNNTQNNNTNQKNNYINNMNSNSNNNNILQNKIPMNINGDSNSNNNNNSSNINLLHNNYNEMFNNNLFNQNQNNLNNSINYQQFLNVLQSQNQNNSINNNKNNQQQQRNNGNVNNLQNMMNMSQVIGMDTNNLLNYFGNQRQLQLNMNGPFSNQYSFNNQQKRKNNDNK